MLACTLQLVGSSSSLETCGLVSEHERAAYARDGVVLLKQRFGHEWLELLQRGIEQELDTPSNRTVRHTPANASAHYYEGVWAWSHVRAIEDFCRHSPVATIAASLMNAEVRVNLVMDNWFVREAGSSGRPPWHHDVSYFDFEGTMTVLWLPLESSRAGTGLSFVRGSHLWGKHFERVGFGGHSEKVGSGQGPGITVNGVTYEPPPDVDGDPESFDVVDFDVNEGDAIFFDIRTVHGAREAFTPTRTSRRFSLRLAKEDTRLQYRGEWAEGERAVFEAAGHREGDFTHSEHFFPAVLQAAGSIPQ